MNNDLTLQTARNFIDVLVLFEKKFIKPHIHSFKSVISPLQFYILILLKNKGALAMSDVAKEISVSGPNVTTLVDKLFAMNFVKREYDLDDRRVINVILTEKGQEFLDNHTKHIEGSLSIKLQTLPLSDIKLLCEALATVKNIADKIS